MILFVLVKLTYIDSSVQSDDRDISISGYSLIWSDHPSNKRGGVCIYYCESLAVHLGEINYLNECLLYVKSPLTIKKVTLQSYIDPQPKSIRIWYFYFKFWKMVIFTLLTPIF